MKKKRVYIIGICGVTTAAIAKMFKDMGWEVSGSDQGGYPPMTDYLETNDIHYKPLYNEANLAGKVDLVVIGGNALIVNPLNPEYLKARGLGLKIVSYPEVLERYVIKKNSIVIAGTYGKTTIAALVAWILEKSGHQPSFMLGGLALNFPDGVRRTDSEYSVVEGDEHPTLHFSPEPKFMHYRPRYALITAAQWDHLNVFKKESVFVRAFEDFVKLLPRGGLLVLCLDGKNVRGLSRYAKCPVVSYALKSKADFQAKEIIYGSDYTYFKVNGRSVISPFAGEHNVQNVLGAYCLTASLGIKPEIINEAIRSFKGIKRRLEVRAVVKGITVVDDLAHSPVKIRETLKALRLKFKDSRLWTVFDPHASSFRDRRTLSWYRGVFDDAAQVLVGKMPLFRGTPLKERVSGKELVATIGRRQPHVQYFPKDEMIIRFLLNNLRVGDVVVFVSSGGFRGIIDKTIEELKK